MFKLKLGSVAAILLMTCLFAPVATAQSKKDKAQAAEPQPIPEEQKKIVAVLEPVGGANVTKMNRTLARATLEDFISRSREYRVVDRSYTDQVMAELGYQRDSGMVNESDAKNIGKQLGADFVAVSEILKEEGEAHLTVAIVNVETGIKNVRSGFLETDSNKAISEELEELASRLLGVERRRDIQNKQEAARAAQDAEMAKEAEKSAKRGATLGKVAGASGRFLGAVLGTALVGDPNVFKDDNAGRPSAAGAPNAPAPQYLSGVVRDTRIKYEVCLMQDNSYNQIVRVRFDAVGVGGAAIQWELDGAVNVESPGGYTSVDANSIRDVVLRIANPSYAVRLGRFLVKKVGY